MVHLSKIIQLIESEIPLAFQEDYDNSGIQVGDPALEINSILLSLDVTEEVVDEAIATGSELVISHHPLIFKGLKRISGKSMVERVVIKAIKNNIAIYSSHTNLDVIPGGVSYRMAEKIGLESVEPLLPFLGNLAKLVVFVPSSHSDLVREALFEAGAGISGNYDHCSFNSAGTGTFRPGNKATPYLGEIGVDHVEEEVRIETMVNRHILPEVIRAMIAAHPYEEVAYDIINIENSLKGAGMGVIGNLNSPIKQSEFLSMLADKFGSEGIRYGKCSKDIIERVALCGGSGSSLSDSAVRAGADAFVTADIKYHSFFDADGRMLLTDIGHHESEKYSLEILYEIITKKIPKFAVRFSKINTNPVNYLPNGKSKSS